MALAAIVAQLGADLGALELELRSFVASKPNITVATTFSLHDECLLEGLLSRIWQSWSIFCRRCIVESCMGTTTISGAVVPPHPYALSQAHVSAAAIRARRRPSSTVFWGNMNRVLRDEPTWGDVNVLADIVPRLGPSNQLQLQAAFSAGSQSAKAVQTIRNAAAHTNQQTVAEVLTIGASYVTFAPTHPTHAMFWTVKATGDFLIANAIAELLNTASAAAT